MSDKQPTPEQIEKVWEWCGWEWHPAIELWKSPAPESCLGYGTLPLINLDNLFQWAVPKLITCELRVITGMWHAHVSVGAKHTYGDNEDPALALFWAILEVIENE